MAFAAPMAVEGVTAGGTAASAAGAGAATSRAGAAASSRAGTKAAGARTGTKTAAARADELVTAGGPRYRQRRALQDELGATAAQADDLLDAAGSRTPDEPAPARAGSKPAVGEQIAGSVRQQVGKGVGGAINSAGGLFFGVLTYVLTLTYLRGGMPAVKSWLAAKFLNRVPGSSSSSTSAAPTTAGGSNAGSGLIIAGELSPDGSKGVGASGAGVAGGGGGGW